MKSKNILRAAMIISLIIPLKGLDAQAQRMYVEGPGLRPFIHQPRGPYLPLPGASHAPFRTFDGTNNNTGANRAEWGAADVALFRELPANYGPSDPKNAMGGVNRPSGRAISNALCDEPVTFFNDCGVSTFFFVWGQFIDHDITLTPVGDTEPEPIALPPGEQIFTTDIPFFRSKVRSGTGQTSKRQQSNLNTAWIDASTVYGADNVRAAWLRTFQDGKLKTSAGHLLPWNTVTGEQGDPIDPSAPSMANDADHTVKTFVAGDVRASEHPGLLSLHTLFVREHNRICDRMLLVGYHHDELIYQKARKEVGAIIQAITYNEFLPAIGVMPGPYKGYKRWIRPDITNTFATAGYRLGHTMVTDSVALRDDACQAVTPGEMTLMNIFFNPQLIVDYGMEPFLMGFATHKQFETDTKINNILRNFLFGPGTGLDLASINIQRGRDHGLPDYNKVRQYYTGSAATSFSDITSDVARQNKLAQLYGNVNHIDLWVGILAEDRMSGMSVGKTLHAILKRQFTNLRDGDFYFYLHDPYLPWIIRLKSHFTRLSDIIKRNSALQNLQKNVFYFEACPGEDGEMRLADSGFAGDDAFHVFPNPSSEGSATIVIRGNSESGAFELTDLNGRVVRRLNGLPGESSIRFECRDLLPGVYLVRRISGGSPAAVKFVKLVNP